MIGLYLLALFPVVLSKSVASADITEVQVCQYFDARIQRFEEKVKEMKECKLFPLFHKKIIIFVYRRGCGFGILQNVGSF